MIFTKAEAYRMQELFHAKILCLSKMRDLSVPIMSGMPPENDLDQDEQIFAIYKQFHTLLRAHMNGMMIKYLKEVGSYEAWAKEITEVFETPIEDLRETDPNPL